MMKKNVFNRLSGNQCIFICLILLFTPAHAISKLDNHTNDNSNSHESQNLSITNDTLAKDPATDLIVPFSNLKDTNPKLDSAINQLVRSYKTGGISLASTFAPKRGISIKEDLAQVIIELDLNPDIDTFGNKLAFLNDEISSLGGNIELRYKHLIQAYLPVDVLEKVASWLDVRLIRMPFRPVPMVTSEGVSLVNADAWQASGFTGIGIKIGIIDVDFNNYTSLLGTELPSSVNTNFFTPYSNQTSSHGTAVAEIIYDMAPDAELLLTEPGTDVELGIAIDWLISHGVNVINHSAGWNIANGPLDGTGSINNIVDSATESGITWVNSAGNNCLAHWGGVFSDPDEDGWLNFFGDVNDNRKLTTCDNRKLTTLIQVSNTG